MTTKEWAEKFGLNEVVAVAPGAAIFGAVAAGRVLRIIINF